MNTVNVIETGPTGLVNALQSFPDTPEGNTEAETLFRRIVDNKTDMWNEVDEALDDGYAEIPSGGHVMIVHSSPFIGGQTDPGP